MHVYSTMTGTITSWMFSCRLTQPERGHADADAQMETSNVEQKKIEFNDQNFECDAKLRPVRLSPHSLITLRAISGIKCANAADGLESSLLGGGGKWHGRQPWETAPEQREPADYPSWRDGLSGSNESKSNERQITTLPLSFSSSVISARLLCLARRNWDASPCENEEILF